MLTEYDVTKFATCQWEMEKSDQLHHNRAFAYKLAAWAESKFVINLW